MRTTTDTGEELRLQDEERRIAANRNAAVTRIVQLVYFLTGALGCCCWSSFACSPLKQPVCQLIYDLSNPFVAAFASLDHCLVGQWI